MATDVENLLTSLGVQVAAGGGREISAHCPFHEDHHPSFSIAVSTGLWICYQCGRAGTLSMLVEAVEGGDREALIREVRYQSIGQAEKEPEKPPEHDPALVFARYESYRLPPPWARLDRRLRLVDVQEYGLKWDRGWIIPIWEPRVDDPSAAFWGWQYKRLDVVANFPPAVKKSQTLFGLRELRSSEVVLVESPLDVVRLASVGIAAVSSYGALVSKVQLKLLVECADRIWLALDDDEEGERQTEKIYPVLAKFVPTDTVVMPRGCKDPGDLSDRQIARVFRDISRRALLVPTRSGRNDGESSIAPTHARSGPR
jgi:DNA primase